MASLQKKVQIRNGHRIHVKRLMAEMSGLTQGDVLNLKKIEKSLNEKATVLKNFDNDILELIDEADVDTLLTEIQDSSNLSDEINETLIKIEHMLKSVETTVSSSTLPGATPVSTNNVIGKYSRLPKLEIAKFEGDVLQWQGFWDQFSAAIDSNSQLKNIDKFNYLKTYLGKKPLDIISGLTLSSSNYLKALDILRERYGNKQILISSHMDVLVKLPRATSYKDIETLRKIYNSLETSVRNLTELNVDINSYGTLLISLILERIPSELKVIISRRFKDDVCDLLSLIEIFKEELFARERIEAIDNTENSFEGENLFTAQTLANHSYKNNRLDKYEREKQVCVYCQSKNHISTRCVNVKNVETRKNILRSSGRCYLYLNKGHRIQHFRVKYACAKCSSKTQNVSICEKVKQDKEIKNEDDNEAPPTKNVVMQVKSNSQSILLQTTKTKIFNCDENSPVRSLRHAIAAIMK